ncbi:hypothetical protein BIY23_01310 [Wolbachia pipientis]|uniref:Uncharacterized protein n=1 Tax=Wolbachia pipientis TaxID=955 RepID=A0A1E7QL85_WOLPI|nr:hypothetical protein [Wolbachia pipientis]OEY87106.1 hypothetical protein BIY23_01310 [Wolbachia pipientis]
MIRNISIINKNLLSIEITNQQVLEHFIKICTVLDKHKAAKALFADEVTIEYKQHDSIEYVELYKNNNFLYHDIENIVYHLYDHGIKITNSIMANTITAAHALESKGIAFSLFNSCLQCNIRVNKNIFTITPMCEKHLWLQSHNSKMLINSLKSVKTLYYCVLKKNTVNLIVHSDVQQVINIITESLIKSSLLAKSNEQILKAKLRQLAFKDQAFIEYSSIKTINQYPRNHPLRKYEGIAKNIEDILCDFIEGEGESSESAVERLNQISLKLSPDTPKIITKTIDKLVKFH